VRPSHLSLNHRNAARESHVLGHEERDIVATPGEARGAKPQQRGRKPGLCLRAKSERFGRGATGQVDGNQPRAGFELGLVAATNQPSQASGDDDSV
jgi:hypothetical protein